uniref:Sushi domain-containing protein n=1 Tax=Branchiostoma floridae TaxID=7739 RepID=C3ZT32_BRAFL|eukprot:XP_002588227.1 hypothetical protein BRAFLDRAFT_124695 [Branchiostoma floridae]
MGPPTNGIRVPAKRFYNVGERVTYTCNEGYNLDFRHTSRVTCFEDGIWQYDKPSCSVDISGKLEEDLLNGYSESQPPDIERGGHTIIVFNGTVEEVIDLDEKKERLVASIVIDFTWRDSRLEWKPKYFGNIETLSVVGSSIWTPTFTLKRNADPLYRGLPDDVLLLISTDGTVRWRVETLTSTICTTHPFFFPADTMECHICFSVSPAIDQIVECGGGSSCDVWSSPQQEGEWNRKDKIFAKGNKEACFAVQLERIPLFHIATTVGPCAILVVLMTITFIMPIDKGDRIAFGVTIQLSMVVSLVFVTEVLPVKGQLPFLATLIVVCMGLMGLFLFFTMGIITLHDKEGSLSPMSKTFFLQYMAKFLLLGDLTEKEAASEDGEAGLTVRTLAYRERTDRDVPADGMAEVDGKSPAALSETIRQLSGPLTRMETAMSSGFRDLISIIEDQAMKNEQEISDYTLLARVLDRLCLVLYVISIAVAVPMTMHLGTCGKVEAVNFCKRPGGQVYTDDPSTFFPTSQEIRTFKVAYVVFEKPSETFSFILRYLTDRRLSYHTMGGHISAGCQGQGGGGTRGVDRRKEAQDIVTEKRDSSAAICPIRQNKVLYK